MGVGHFLLAALLLAFTAAAPAAQAEWRVASDRSVKGFQHPESVAYDYGSGQLFVSDFGSELKPTLKNGKGVISRVDMSGKILERKFLPAAGQVLHKPKGLWIKSGKMWATDIDCIWVFDLKTRKGVKAALPGAVFANDPVEGGGKLFVSDTGTGAVYQISPADFLEAKPTITKLVTLEGVSPNGLWYTRKGRLLVAGYPKSGGGPIYHLEAGGLKRLTKDLGRLDGLARLDDGSYLYTDWSRGGLFLLGSSGKPRMLAGGMKGPADFAVIDQKDGLLVVAPDLVTGNLRFIKLTR